MGGDFAYQAVMDRRADIVRNASGVDYASFERSPVAFDYEAMMRSAGYPLDEVRSIQREARVGHTPLLRLDRMTDLVRSMAPTGKGAQLWLKDEAANPSGSFKDRRAALAVYHAAAKGFPGVVAATSGNYGAAVASQAARRGLACIVVQEAYDSAGRGQPEILEKARACEAYGAEVLQCTVGPELFAIFLHILEETGCFNASLYTPFAIAGIETLGYELAQQILDAIGKFPDTVMVTHAGGGNVTGTARGLQQAGAVDTEVIGVSVDLSGLHMASDTDFNRKSFSTGHTGFGIPFATWPDRADVPRNAARPLRYLDRYVTVTQGEVFYITEALAQLEGLERGPAGNTSLAAAVALARTMDRDAVVVIQESEYTGAGKHPTAQLTFAREMGVEVLTGDPHTQEPGRRIVIPDKPERISAVDVDLDRLRRSYVVNAVKAVADYRLTTADEAFLAEDARTSREFVRDVVAEAYTEVGERWHAASR